MNKNNQLAAMVVRNIDEIEEANHKASYDYSSRLWKEFVSSSKRSIQEDWSVEGEDEYEEYFHLVDWAPKGVGHEEFWLEIDEEVHPDCDNFEHSWISIATQSGILPSKLVINFSWDVKQLITEAKFRKLIGSQEELRKRLADHGFVLSDDGKALRTLIEPVGKDALAKAFEEDDFDEALESISTAVAKATSKEVLGDLNILVGLIRTEAQRK